MPKKRKTTPPTTVFTITTKTFAGIAEGPTATLPTSATTPSTATTKPLVTKTRKTTIKKTIHTKASTSIVLPTTNNNTKRKNYNENNKTW